MGTCESRQEVKETSKKYLTSPEGQANQEDKKNDLNGEVKLRRQHTFESDFIQYYKHIKKTLKAKNFKFNSQDTKVMFFTKVAAINGIDKETAKVWVHMYVDYMILVAWWNSYSKTTMVVYPPYAIQQVARLHTVYIQNYKEFCKIINENKGIINIAPSKVIIKQSAEDLNTLRNAYSTVKEYIWHQIYNNPYVQKTEDTKKHAEAVWEPFETTLIKSEFSFCFLRIEDAGKFNVKLHQYLEETKLKSREAKEIIRVAEEVRDIIEAGNLLEGSGRYEVSLRDCFVNPSKVIEKSGFMRVDAISFTTEFINALAWEYRISTEKALQWALEYKKFLFLLYGFNGKTTIMPSDIVAKVWHLHMQYVQEYQVNVYKTLKLHYIPAKDPTGEEAKEVDVYKETVKIYTKYFGTPDAEIWPASDEKFIEFALARNYEAVFGRRWIAREERSKRMSATFSMKQSIGLKERLSHVNSNLVSRVATDVAL